MKLLSGLLKEMESIKIKDIAFYDAVGKSIFADIYVISTADSMIQIESARNKLIEYMKKNNTFLKNPMEEWHGGWCLLDFGNTIVHIFLEEMRSFYDLESLFQGAGFKPKKLTEMQPAVKKAPVKKAAGKPVKSKKSVKNTVKAAKKTVRKAVKEPVKASKKGAKPKKAVKP
jgi:ribosome-associated protein